MYDLNKNGYITRDEFKFILNMMVGSNITPDQANSFFIFLKYFMIVGQHCGPHNH